MGRVHIEDVPYHVSVEGATEPAQEVVRELRAVREKLAWLDKQTSPTGGAPTLPMSMTSHPRLRGLTREQLCEAEDRLLNDLVTAMSGWHHVRMGHQTPKASNPSSSTTRDRT